MWVGGCGLCYDVGVAFILQVYQLYVVLVKKRDPISQMSFLDNITEVCKVYHKFGHRVASMRVSITYTHMHGPAFCPLLCMLLLIRTCTSGNSPWQVAIRAYFIPTTYVYLFI